MDFREQRNKEAMKKKLAKLLKKINLNYQDFDTRYSLVLKALLIAKKLGYDAGFRHDKSEPDWPVVTIDLPEIGQVSWHMPPCNLEYDNSTPDDCKRRCEEFFSKQDIVSTKGKYDR